jgi:hypothetical protein
MSGVYKAESELENNDVEFKIVEWNDRFSDSYFHWRVDHEKENKEMRK